VGGRSRAHLLIQKTGDGAIVKTSSGAGVIKEHVSGDGTIRFHTEYNQLKVNP
jgi:hypothetical protein